MTKYKLGEIIELNPRESIKKGNIARKIAMDDLGEFKRDIESYSYSEYKGGTKFRNYDTLMARITPCLENGKTSFVNILEENEVAFGSTEYFVFRAKQDIINPYYLYYLVTTDKFREVAIKSMSGTSGRQRVQKDQILDFSVDLPSLEDQEKIMKPLKLIDDKISLNNKLNTNLEKISTKFFLNWLSNTHSDKKKSLDSIANYKNGLAMQKFRPVNIKESLPVVKIRELNQGHTDSNSDLCRKDIDKSVQINTGDIIFSWSGTLLLDLWAGTEAGLNQHLFKVTSNDYPSWFIYEWTKYYLQEFQLIAKSKATTMGHIKRSNLKESFAITPGDNELTKLNNLLGPIFDNKIKIRKQNLILKQIKKQLLAKLLN